MRMSALLEGALAVTLALTAGEGVPPGMAGRRAAQVLGQLGERGEGGHSSISGKGGMGAPLVRRAPGGAEALRSAGDQDEIGRGGRIGGEARLLVVDEETTVEAFADLDAVARVGAAVRAARDLHHAGAEPDGVVAGHAAGVAAAEVLGQVARRPAPH